MALLTGFTQAFKTPDLRKKLLFTLGVVAVFRFGSTLPAPGISEPAVRYCSGLAASRGSAASILAVLNAFSGNSLLHVTVFALGITPYITASIIVQLLTQVIPRLHALKDEGRPGRSGPGALRLGEYTLTLPAQYHLADARTPVCAAAAASGVCVLMFLTPSFRPGLADPDVPRGAAEVTIGRTRAWLAPRGDAGTGTTLLVIAGGAAGGQIRDLVIGASGLSQHALVSLVSSGLSAA